MADFNKDYFVNSKISNYKDYRKRKFDNLAKELHTLLNLTEYTRVLDYGCATGGLVKSLKDLGTYSITGIDISDWAIKSGRKMYGLKSIHSLHNFNHLFDYDITLFLDVLEHVATREEIMETLEKFGSEIIVIRLPVSAKEGEHYVLEVSRNDLTHLQCHTKEWWHVLFEECGFELESIIEGEHIYEAEGVLSRVYKK